MNDADLLKRLRKQLGEDAGKALNSLLERYDYEPAAAYKGWLFSYIDANICVDHFVIEDAKKFATPPRSMAAIAQLLSSGIQVAKPKPKARSDKKGNQTPAHSSSKTTPPSSGKPLPDHQTQSATTQIAPANRWHDPLAVCTLRTAGLAGKTGAMFGWTRNGGKKNHQGIDLAANPGTPIYAVADGIVYSKKSPSSSYAYGNTLVLEVGINDLPEPQAAEFRRINPNARTIGFFYAHLSGLPDTPKQIVKSGDVIGKTGSSGNASKMTSIALGAHLHFEVRLEARKVATGLANRADPLPFIVNCTNR